jgi:squalene-hopene/tetraprenyl-beta-curcumene cyclase
MFKDANTETHIGNLSSSSTAIYSKAYNLNKAISRAQDKLLSLQDKDGYWVFELEADCTIPAEYILMMHYLGEIDGQLQTKMANYLRSRQSEDGSYPLFTGGPGDISCSVKVYYALKLAGDSPDAKHMSRLRNFILSKGGAAKANVFTRIALATFEQLPWRGVPYIPVEIMLFPSWFPFHLDKVAYWSRTVMVPLFILCTLKATAKNPNKVGILELFVTHPDEEKHYFPERTFLN